MSVWQSATSTNTLNISYNYNSYNLSNSVIWKCVFKIENVFRPYYYKVIFS